MAGENIGEISYLDYLEEKTLANGLQMKAMGIEYYVNLREKTLAIGHQFAKFANIFSRQHFPLYSINAILTAYLVAMMILHV